VERLPSEWQLKWEQMKKNSGQIWIISSTLFPYPPCLIQCSDSMI
jgi:hypothetical protein